MKFVHLNIISKDWKKLADFYIKVFQCEPMWPERDLNGKWLDESTAIENARISGIHLRLPGFEEGSPTLEIFQYSDNIIPSSKKINTEGITHMAFRVDNVKDVLKQVLKNGGTQVGKITQNEIEGTGTINFVYTTDPEGNIIEIQHWS
jgi:predicted enzyme related to lactoylglutathione lyase